jgi:kynureninase
MADLGASDGSGYMLYHSVGQYAGKAHSMAAAMAEFANNWSSIEGGHWPYALGQVQHFLARWRDLIDAPAHTVTTAENVTAAFSAVLNALPESYLKGRTVLVAEDCFPSNHFLLTGLSERLGFSLRTVPLRQGASWVEDEDFLSHWTPEVGLALLTWISSVSSHKCDLDALVAHGKAMGSLVGVDLTQGIGLVPFSATATSVDFAVSTSLKWTCGSPGAGMLYVTPHLIGECQPKLRGWFSQPDPFNWDITRFSYAPDIRRFDNGTPSVMACAATVPALDWHAAQNKAAIRAHNLELCAALQDGALACGFRPASPRDPNARGGSIMVQLESADAVQTMIASLAAANVQADGRGRVLRLSPGVLTTHTGIERALAVMSRAR